MAISTAVDLSARASVVGIKTEYVQLSGSQAVALPQRVMVVGQGNSASTYLTDKRTFTQASDVGAVYGYGSPVHLAAKQLKPVNGDGLQSVPMTIYPLEDDGAGLPSVGDVTPTNAATETANYQIKINNQLSEAFTVANGDSVGAIVAAMVVAVNAVLDMPVIASDNTTDMVLTSKWAGASANDITIEVVGPSVGVTFALTQPVGGATNPDVDDALNQVGEVWETMLVSCFDVADTGTLDKYRTFGDGRWGPLVKKPLVTFTGSNIVDVTAATAVSSVRTTDRVNGQVPAPGSASLPCEIAARAVARYAQVANNKPANDYLRLVMSGIAAGTDGEQWDYTERDQAVKAGSSTTKVQAGEVLTEDTSTFYYPVGDPSPAYAKVATIVKLSQVIYNTDLIFDADSWAGAPLIPDFQATTNPDAKQPKDAVSEIGRMIDQLALAAIISDPETAKQSIVAAINGTNPNRLDISFTVQIAGNTNIKSIDLNFGFFFG